jgi:hypothetical protein
MSLNVAAFLAAAPARLLRRGRQTAAQPSAPHAGQPSASVSINSKFMTTNKTQNPSPKEFFILAFSFLMNFFVKIFIHFETFLFGLLIYAD